MNHLDKSLTTSGVYEISFKGCNIKYIGCAKNIRRRALRHLQDLRHDTHVNKKLQYIFNILGEELIMFKVLKVLPMASLTQLQFQEAISIESALCSGQMLFNIKVRGSHRDMNTKATISKSHVGSSHSDETKTKMSDKARRRLSKEDQAGVIEKVLTGMPYKAISDVYGISVSRVSQIFSRRHNTERSWVKMTPELKQIVLSLFDGGMTMGEISDSFNINRSSISTLIRKRNIPSIKKDTIRDKVRRAFDAYYEQETTQKG